MGRYAESLINAPPLPVIENHVEILIAESRLAYRDANEPDVVDEEQLMTVLVSFDPTPALRWSARALAATFITAQCQFEQVPLEKKLGDWLGGLLNARVAASLCIVLLLPEYSAEAHKQISALLTGLKEAPHHHLNLTIAVSQKPSDWNVCTKIDGFVLLEAQAGDSAVLEVFNMLASLMAPGMSVCVDGEDLRTVFGTADQPSRIANGVWLPDVEVFEVATHEDRRMLKASSRVAFMPATSLRVSSQIKLLIAIRKSAANDTEFVMVAPYGMATASRPASRTVPVTLVIAIQPHCCDMYEDIVVAA